MSRLNVDALFFSLAVSGILEIQKMNEEIKWLVGWQPPVLPQSNGDVTFVKRELIPIFQFVCDWFSHTNFALPIMSTSDSGTPLDISVDQESSNVEQTRIIHS